MKNLIIVLCMWLLTSCVTSKKAYNYIARDPVVDGSELVIMGQKCKWLFPEKISAPVSSGKGIDSTDYITAIDNQNLLLDQLISAQAYIDSLTNRKPCDVSLGDSARIIKNYLNKYKPQPVKIHDTTEVEVESLSARATINLQANEIIGLRAENSVLQARAIEAVEKLDKKSSSQWWLIAICVLMGFGNIYQLFNRRV